MFPPLILFSSFFLTYLLPYLSFPSRIDPLHFRPRCRKRQLNLAFVFLCLFCVVVHLFWSVNASFCCVRFSFFYTKPRAWLGETSLKWPILCRVRCKTTTQVNFKPQSIHRLAQRHSVFGLSIHLCVCAHTYVHSGRLWPACINSCEL